ncbi:MAG: transposase [Pseudobacteriovorax sp.]|nr:transposase [Pseudobacteriovorax sp.]
MKRSKFTEEQIIKAIKRQEAGEKTTDICRDLGISQGTFYKWKSKFGGMEVSEAKRLKCLEDENKRLKRLVADLSLDKQALKYIVEKKL